MTNHFSSLLINLATSEATPSVKNYFLGTDLSELLSTENNELLVLEDIKTYIEYSRMYNVLINKDYNSIELPSELSNFYDLIFPKNSSDYYKQFLLYTYLRIISATSLSEKITEYDSRVTYDLEDIDTYFRLNKLSVPLSSNPTFKLYPSGKFTASERIQSPVQTFIIKQKENTDSVYIFSLMEKKYYKENSFPSDLYLNMESTVQFSSETSDISNSITIGDTGLNFFISSPEGLPGFTASSNKLWTFSVDTPLYFNYIDKIAELNKSEYIVENMLAFRKEFCNFSNEYCWRTHFNDVYKLAGLLCAYVERVHLLWQERAT